MPNEDPMGSSEAFSSTSTGFKDKTNKNHILTKKAPKRKRQLRGMEGVAAENSGIARMPLTKLDKRTTYARN